MKPIFHPIFPETFEKWSALLRQLGDNNPIPMVLLLALAASCFTLGILGVRGDQLLEHYLKGLYRLLGAEWQRAMFFGATTSALGMIFVSLAITASPWGATAAMPILAAFSAIGSVWAGMRLDNKGWTDMMLLVTALLVAIAALLSYLAQK